MRGPARTNPVAPRRFGRPDPHHPYAKGAPSVQCRSWIRHGPWLLCLAAACALVAGCGREQPKAAAVRIASIHLASVPASVTEGATVQLTATAQAADGAPVPGAVLQAFVDGSAWGAPETTDGQGLAVLPLPLPNTGNLRLQVGAPAQNAAWIWPRGAAAGQPVYLVRAFTVSPQLLGSSLAQVSSEATLNIVADRQFVAYLNGHRVAAGSTLGVQTSQGLGQLLHAGGNVLAVEAWGGQSPGLVAQLSLRTLQGALTVTSDGGWRAFSRAPADWGGGASGLGGALPLRVLGPAGDGFWQGRPIQDGAALGLTPLTPGAGLPTGWVASPPVRVAVQPVHLQVHPDPRHMVGMEYEPWFTPRNMTWQTAEAIPLLGRYSSTEAAVLRQHALWLDRAGIDFLLIDWSNNLWGKTSWSQRAPNIQELVNSTTLLLDTYAGMRAQGLPTPQVTLLLGLDNGASTTTTALNEEMAWVEQNYVWNPKYQGLWVRYLGKPLIVIFNGGGPGALSGQPPISTSAFTVRWMSSQLQLNHLADAGYWSWMDGSVDPVVTDYQGQPEVMTVTPAFFGSGGWTGPAALARLGGTTYLREFARAMQVRPRFLLINQFNEFAGQPASAPVHVDTYTEALSDDIEPTSVGDCGYASCGGWGFYYLDLTRALVAMYHESHPRSTLLAVGSPLRDADVCGASLPVSWTTVGAPPQGVELELDGHVRARGVRGSADTLALRGLSRGPHTLTVVAEQASTRYVLSRAVFGGVLAHPVPTQVRRTFTYTGPCPAGATSSPLPAGIDLESVDAGTVGPAHDPVGPLAPGQTLAEVFTAPGALTSVQATTPTWAHTGSGATLVLRAGAGLGGRMLAQQTFRNVQDNGWLTLTLPSPAPAGVYTLEMMDPTGPAIGWWGSAMMVPGAYELKDGQRQAEELVMRWGLVGG